MVAMLQNLCLIPLDLTPAEQSPTFPGEANTAETVPPPWKGGIIVNGLAKQRAVRLLEKPCAKGSV